MTTGKALNGKPYAGNPHVRFDEGEVASAAMPRRGSLLYNKLRLQVVLAFAALGVAGVALATEYIIPDGSANSFHCQMTNALTKLNSDTSGTPKIVTISKGTYQLNNDEYMDANYKKVAFMPDTKTIIRGDPTVSRDEVVIRGNTDVTGFYSKNRIINIQNITFEDFTYAGNGPVIRGHVNADAEHAAMTVVSNCVFRNCKGTYGGAVYLVSLVDCLFENNEATGGGGGASSAFALRCHFENNRAKSYAGALYQPYAVSNCVFVSNRVTTSYDGGALYGTLAYENEVYGSAFTNNYAVRRGGACACQNTRFKKCTFLGHEAGSDQSSCLYEPLSVEACTFEYNSKGACIKGTAALEVSGCTFLANTNDVGGGICFTQAGHLRDSFVVSNVVNTSGSCNNASVVTNCVFTGNATQVYDGAGVYNCGTMYDCAFTNNHAYRWGGAGHGGRYVRCTFFGNSAGTSANALYKPTSVEDCVFTGDQWCNGGAYTRCAFTNMTVLCINGDTPVALTNCLFAQCSPSRVLGCLSAVNCTFADCYSAGNSLLSMKVNGVLRNCLFYNNSYLKNNKTVRDDAYLSLAGALVADHNAYGVTALDFSQYGTDNIQVSDPKFVGTGAEPYQLLCKSSNRAVRENGLVESWMASAKDLAGNPMLREGKVGRGCYMCWTRPIGLVVVFR